MRHNKSTNKQKLSHNCTLSHQSVKLKGGSFLTALKYTLIIDSILGSIIYHLATIITGLPKVIIFSEDEWIRDQLV